MSRLVIAVAFALGACGRLSFESHEGDGGSSDDGGDGGGPASHVAYLKASNTDAGDEFGAAVAVSRDGSTLAVGAPLESGASRQINGNESDNGSLEQGAVYVFVCAMRDKASKATVAVGGAKADVLYENRSIDVKDGRFDDEVPAYGVRLYKIR